MIEGLTEDKLHVTHGVTLKTITLRELHEKTGEWVRSAGHFGELAVTDRGRTIAKIVPQDPPSEVPYFARRKVSAAFARLMKSGELRGGEDCTVGISEDRDAR